MINIELEGTKKKTWYPTTVGSPVKLSEEYKGPALLEPLGSIKHEALRREAIVKKLYRDCPYRIGDEVEYTKENEKKKNPNDRLIVLNIVSSYAQMGKEEKWPSSDNPLLVHAKLFKEDGSIDEFFCTTNYLKKKGSA